uniref:Palmitoyltransferase n=1 Tax=Schistosoma haematobium TaxID=6185 RepID=A0A095AVI4_SCHHA
MLPYASGIIGAVLPCFMLCGPSDALQERKVALETAVCINETLLKAVRLFNSCTMNNLDSCESIDHSAMDSHRVSLNSGNQSESLVKFSQAENSTKQFTDSSLNTTTDTLSGGQNNSQILCTDAILEATFQLLNNSSLFTRLAALRWITVLAEVCSSDVFSHVDRLLPEMLKLVSDPADEMVHSTISLIGKLSHHTTVIGNNYHNKESVILPQELVKLLHDPAIVNGQNNSQISDCSMETSSQESLPSSSSAPNTFCLRFLLDLVELFNKDSELLRKRGDMIITDLCQVLGADTVYCTVSTIISYIKPLESAFVLVQALNRILLTQPVLHNFRKQLRCINTKKQSDEYRLMKMINHNRNGAQPQNQNSYTISNENRSNRGSLGNVFNKLAVSDEKPSNNIYPTDIQRKIDSKTTVCSANDYLTACDPSAEQKLQFCNVCRGFKPPRAHHCRACNRCIMKMDHHCPWINTCCGHLNHKYFLIFLLFAPFGCITSCISLSLSIYQSPAIFPSLLLRRFQSSVLFVIADLMITLFALGLAVGVALSVGILAIFQLKAVSRNQTGIESWIVAKANVWRKDIGEKKPFRYPYDLGKLVNFQQIFLWSGKVLGDGYYWPVVKGCTQYDLTLEQIYQKRLKQKIQRTFKITQNYDGSRCMCFRYGCLTAIRSPCFEEPRISVRVGDVLMVTRGTKISVVWCDHRGLKKNLGYWIYGHLVPSESCSADFSGNLLALIYSFQFVDMLLSLEMLPVSCVID